eukprot:CAMPEP_0203897734 /NCGR_PEP_ID=MMETSP0359-20131031/40335_1 /ASSEMBLY_ACC=CAM_ASM_000338 /TAXON_ID=268821 /ORGANISM="Scrippsiella Hangoei, Strain SHTV-5" /LENGTH=76 /DNA_ID=CAMNT_0050820683 /DNA_START=343 /DNA_END=570 /DNA_ORIENTATION=-
MSKLLNNSRHGPKTSMPARYKVKSSSGFTNSQAKQPGTPSVPAAEGVMSKVSPVACPKTPLDNATLALPPPPCVAA